MNATLAGLNASNPAYLESIIGYASGAIEKYCMRKFASASYISYQSGGGFPYQQLQLRQFPVTAINRIGTCPTGVITINNSSSSNQRATVSTQIDSNGATASVTLLSVNSAVPTTVVLTAPAYPTLQQLANAVIALGNGWGASVYTGYAQWATADLRPLEGAATALGAGTTLAIYIEDYTSNILAGGWGPWTGCDISSEAWRLDQEAGIVTGYFPQGTSNIRVDYTAGFVTIPEDIQQQVLRLCAMQYESDRRDSAVLNQKIGPYSVTFSEKVIGMIQNTDVGKSLEPYRDYAKQNGVY